MGVYNRSMTQQATYFPPAWQDAFGGLSFGNGQRIMVRWQDKADLFRDQEGREVVSSAVAYLPQMVQIGGRLGLGVLSNPNDAREIRNVGQSPSLDGRQTLVKAWM